MAKKVEDAAPSFEQGLKELEGIVKELEQGELPLEKSLELFEKGVKLSEACRKQLQEAETKVEILLKKEGKIEAEPFELQDGEGGRVTLDDYLADRGRLVDEALERLTPAAEQFPETIHRAMRYSLFAGGKRIRPVLCIAAGEAVAAGRPEVLAGIEQCAATLEMVHTYSLIHDDLPALDNDDFRRGKPTCHKAFGDAMAILAGDALLTLAFRVLARLKVPEKRCVALVAELSRAAGTVEGMIGGQVADLEAERNPVEETHLHYIHRAKTGAMIQVSVRMGAVYCGAPENEFEALSRYGEHIGLAFQIVDDILDVEGTPESLGKTPGKDAQQQKATFPALYGVEESRQQAQRHLEAANAALGPFGDRALRLRELAERIVNRSA